MTDVIDPNKLTKDQLYQALTERGVTDIPTKRARKQEFIDLYVKHISSETETTNGNVNFDDNNSQTADNDDEEIEIREQSNRLKSNLKRPNSKMPSVKKPEAPAEVQLMSNAELASQLRSRGVDVGPIIATTRKVYERKLAELMQGGPPPHFSSSEDEEEEMEDETYEGEMPENEEPEIVPASKSSGYQSSFIRQRPNIRESYSSHERDTYASRQSRSYTGHGVAGSQSSKPAPKKGISLVVKLAVLVVLALLIYLIVVNMEGTRAKPEALSQDSESGKAQT